MEVVICEDSITSYFTKIYKQDVNYFVLFGLVTIVIFRVSPIEFLWVKLSELNEIFFLIKFYSVVLLCQTFYGFLISK